MNTQSPHQSLYYRLLRPSIVIAFCWFLYFPLYAKQFSGHYNIGKQSNSHFSSPTAALAALANDTVTGPVVFHLEEGEYFGLLELLNPVYGVSHKNTVTFTGDGADISKTIINCSVEHVLHFENVQHFRFNNLSIIVQSRYYTAGRIIIDFKDCLDIDFRNVYFDNISLSPYVKNPTTAYNVYLDHSDSCDFVNCNFHQQFISMGCHNVYYYYSKQNTLRNCVFEGGEEAFRQVGSQSDTLSTNLIDSCDISGWGKTAVYNYGFSNLMLMNTKIHDGAGAYDNGYYETNCRGTQLINNTFFVRGVGMQFSSPNNYPNNRTDTTRLINNAVSSDGFALYITGGDLLNIYHNSFRCTQYSEALVIVNSQTKRRFKVVNNIFETYGGSYVMDVNLTKGVPILWDYNNYYRHKSSSYFAYFNKNRYASYAELKKGTYGFKNSRNEDPEFDSLDVRTVATGLNNKGKKLNAGSPFVKTDIDGANRPNKFEKKVDIGPNDYYLYCKNNPTNLREHLAIGQVKLANLQKKSGLDPDGFKYYHHKTAKLRRGATYHIQIDLLKKQSAVQRVVWIDWDYDGVFNDSNEMVVYSASNSDSSYIDSFVVPTKMLDKPTRMRVAVTNTGSKPNACSNFNFGEIEEYDIIMLSDSIPPVITLFGRNIDSTNIYTTYREPGYRAIDNLDGDVTANVMVNDTMDTARFGLYGIRYSVTDTDGNMGSAVRWVLVYDSLAPIITLNGSDTVYHQIHNEYIDSGVVAYDNYDSSLTVVQTGKVDTANPGQYTLQYCVTDSTGNGPYCVYRQVFVIDTIFPIIKLIGDSHVQVAVFESYTDSFFTAFDNDTFTLDTVSTFSGTNVVGTFSITYIATDRMNNSSSVTRTIDVIDTIAPVISLIGNASMSVDRFSNYRDSGFTVYDNYYDFAELHIDTTGSFVGTGKEGTYDLIYTASDPSNNTSNKVTRVIKVLPTSVVELQRLETSIYPNPSTGIFNVALNEKLHGENSVRIYNMQGGLVYSQQLLDANRKVLNLSQLANGEYLLVISNNNYFSSQLISVEK